MDASLAGLQNLIGFHTIARRHESLYAFVARLIRSNLLSERETREILPKSWALSAFAPDDDEVPSPLEDFRAAIPLDARGGEQHKLSIDPWILLPSIAKASKRRLRGCAACFEAGHHSYAFQDSLLARCPQHGLALSDRCPHCSAPLWWRHSPMHQSAFRCPRGCDLMGGLHVGLDDDAFACLAEHLDRHLVLIENLRSRASFVSGPAHVIYPPRLADPELDDVARPADGLTGAILKAIRPHVRNFPKLGAHHDQASGDWRIEVRPIMYASETSAEESNVLESKTRRMMAAFRRGTFRTELPLGDSLDDALLARLGMHAMLAKDRDMPQISVASYMLTTSEVSCLQRILSAGHAAAHAHYDLALRATLEMAASRQDEREDGTRQRAALSIGETITGLIQTPKRLLWIQGNTAIPSHSADAAWASFSESTNYFDT